VVPGLAMFRRYSAEGFVAVFPKARNSVSEIRRIAFDLTSTRGNSRLAYVFSLTLTMIRLSLAFFVAVPTRVLESSGI